MAIKPRAMPVTNSLCLTLAILINSNPVSTIATGGIKLIVQRPSCEANEWHGHGKPSTSILERTLLGLLYKSLFEYETALDINVAIQNGKFDMNGYSGQDGMQAKMSQIYEI
jgi:hypothetical protein